ncbi:MAG: ComF family protein [Lachnospiraceae bacterium]|nr:ComF family protein [Lachnospiraceae bacterium]
MADERNRDRKRSPKRIGEAVMQLIWPRRCPVCFDIVSKAGNLHGGLCCNTCYPKIRFVGGATCLKCGAMLIREEDEYCPECRSKERNFVQGIALMDYTCEAAAHLLWKLKYENGREFADFLTEEMVSRYGARIQSWQAEVILPVPIHKSKKRERGYNQAEVLAKKLGGKLGIPVDPKALVRVKKTVAQKKLNLQERLDNLQGAFAATDRAKAYRRVILLDDIFTTGSTAHVCVSQLLKKGVQEVYLVNYSIGRGIGSRADLHAGGNNDRGEDKP